MFDSYTNITLKISLTHLLRRASSTWTKPSTHRYTPSSPPTWTCPTWWARMWVCSTTGVWSVLLFKKHTLKTESCWARAISRYSCSKLRILTWTLNGMWHHSLNRLISLSIWVIRNLHVIQKSILTSLLAIVPRIWLRLIRKKACHRARISLKW